MATYRALCGQTAHGWGRRRRGRDVEPLQPVDDTIDHAAELRGENRDQSIVRRPIMGSMSRLFGRD